MEAMFITHQELIELTGYKAPHCQARWLDRNRWRYVLNTTTSRAWRASTLPSAWASAPEPAHTPTRSTTLQHLLNRTSPH